MSADQPPDSNPAIEIATKYAVVVTDISIASSERRKENEIIPDVMNESARLKTRTYADLVASPFEKSLLGALLLLPPIRAVVRPGLAFLVLRRVSLPVVVGTRGAGWAANRARGQWNGSRRGDDIEGHASEPRGDVVDGTATETRLDDPPVLEDRTDEDPR